MLARCCRVCVCACALARARSLLVFAPSARRCFFLLVADVSLARGHSPHTADMGKAPVFYSEIGKKARGSLFFFFLLIKAFGLQCLLGLPVCCSTSLCKHSTVHAIFRLQERGFFPPASPITSPEVWKETGEKPCFVLYLKV